MSSILSLTDDAIRRVEKNNIRLNRKEIRKKHPAMPDIDPEILLLAIIILFLLHTGADTTLLAAILYVIL